MRSQPRAATRGQGPAVRSSCDAPGAGAELITASSVEVNYFETLGVPLVAGRAFDSGDVRSARLVVMVNEYFVDEILQRRNAIGRRDSLHDARQSARRHRHAAELSPPYDARAGRLVRDHRRGHEHRHGHDPRCLQAPCSCSWAWRPARTGPASARRLSAPRAARRGATSSARTPACPAARRPRRSCLRADRRAADDRPRGGSRRQGRAGPRN